MKIKTFRELWEDDILNNKEMPSLLGARKK